MRRSIPAVVLLVVLAIGAVGHGGLSAAQATPLVFELINVPGSTLTRANGISPDFITGLYLTGTVNHGFLYFPAWNYFKRLDIPNIAHTQLQKGSLNGVVGFYQATNGAAMRGFRYNFGTATFDELDYPGSSATTPWGVNVHGDVVGGYVDATGNRAFLLKNGSFTNIDVPGSFASTGLDINVHGDIVGRYVPKQGEQTRMFLRTRDGAYQTIHYPGGIFTGNPGLPGGINDHGEIVGVFQDGQDMKVRGFLLDATGYHPLDDANPARFMAVVAGGIDNDGNIVGRLRITGGGDSGFLIRRQR